MPSFNSIGQRGTDLAVAVAAAVSPLPLHLLRRNVVGRARHLRQLAEDARAMAQRSRTIDSSNNWKAMAERWELAAAEQERQENSRGVPPRSLPKYG